MVETSSSMLPLGTQLDDFSLPDTVSHKNISLAAIRSDIATVVMFICNHCPFVKHIQPKLMEIVKYYQNKGVVFIAINSNDVEHYPADSPENMSKESEQQGYTFPYLFDETQKVAKAFSAACTPDFYILDIKLHCIYRGRFDDSTPGNHRPVTGAELSQALDNILAGKPVSAQQEPSRGCNIKWKQ